MAEQVKAAPDKAVVAEQIRSVGIDEIVASAATGVLRALEARKIGGRDTSLAELVRAGFGVKFTLTTGQIPSDTTSVPSPPVG